jgi:hypothetical protein
MDARRHDLQVRSGFPHRQRESGRCRLRLSHYSSAERQDTVSALLIAPRGHAGFVLPWRRRGDAASPRSRWPMSLASAASRLCATSSAHVTEFSARFPPSGQTAVSGGRRGLASFARVLPSLAASPTARRRRLSRRIRCERDRSGVRRFSAAPVGAPSPACRSPHAVDVRCCSCRTRDARRLGLLRVSWAAHNAPATADAVTSRTQGQRFHGR